MAEAARRVARGRAARFMGGDIRCHPGRLLAVSGIVLGLASFPALAQESVASEIPTPAQTESVSRTPPEMVAAQPDAETAPLSEQDVPASGPEATTAAEELAAAAAAAAEDATRVTPAVPRRTPPAPVALRRVVVGPSAYLAPDELAEVARGLEERRLTSAQLDQVTAAFDALYDARGIALAQTVVERVDAAGGTVELGFIEARIDRVSVQGQLAPPEYYAERIGLASGDLADTRLLEERLLRLALLSGVRSTVDFTPGSAPGETVLSVTMEEPPRYQGTVTLDTHGTESTGRYRVTLSFSDASLTGRLDRLGASLTLAEGLASGALSYNRPIGMAGTQAFALLTGETSRTISGPLVRGRNALAEIGLSHPVILRAETQVFLRGSVFAFGERRETAGVPTTRQSGFGATLGGSIAAERRGMNLSLDATLRLIRWQDRVLGLNGLSTSYLTLEGAALAPLGGATGPLMAFRVGAQAVGGREAPAQFRGTVASAQRVRGYPSGTVSGDRYLWASAELRAREGWALGPRLRAVPYAFADIGRGWDRTGGVTTAQPIGASVGVGAALAIGTAGSGDLFVALPLRAVGTTARGDIRLEARLGLRF